MNKILISSNYENLKKNLENDQRKYCYITAESECIGIEDFFKKKKYEHIDIRQGIDSAYFKKEYIDFIGRLNCHYNSVYWWANSISYKNILVSNLYQQIYDYYCIIAFLKQHRCDCIIISSNSVLNSSIRKYCQENETECLLLDAVKKKNPIIHFRRCFLTALYFLNYGWSRKILIRLYLSKKIKKAINVNKSYYVIKSWAENRSFAKDGRYTDLFFGKLLGYLSDQGRDFIVLTGILNDYKEIILKIKGAQEFLIIPQEYFVGYMDYLKVVLLSFIKRPKIERPAKFINLDVTDFLIESLKKDYENNEVNKNLVYYCYIKSMLKNIKINTFTFTFENQALEKMSLFALRKYSPQTNSIGYIHSSITQFQLSYFYSRAEEGIMPFPDKIITTGKEPKFILESLAAGYVDKARLSEGCALRFDYLFNKQPIKRRNSKNILAAFSVYMYYSLELLNFLCGALKEKNEYKVILRAHPLTPLGPIMKKWNIQSNNNFSISQNIKLDDDLKETNLFIYVDTTASIEALMRGIPTIRIDLKEPVSLDPLFKLNNLKWTVSNKDELVKTIDYIFSMDEREYLKKYDETVNYLKRYFYPAEERYLKEFII